MKIEDEKGEEIAVYTAAEVQAARDEEVKKAEGTWTPKLQATEAELKEAKIALGNRASEFGQFRKLSDEAVAKLDVAQKTIYENQLVMAKMREDNEVRDKKNLEVTIDGVIKAKVGTDEKAVAKVKEMWGLFNIEATTVEQIENKTKMILGAIQSTQPDLLNSVRGFGNGSHLPPGDTSNREKTFADSERGKAIASELGMITEAPKK